MKPAAEPTIEQALTAKRKLTPLNFLQGETVTMNFPVVVKLQLDDGEGTVTFNPGVQEVPVEYKDHWWLKSNGVTAVKGSKAEAIKEPVSNLPTFTEKHVAYMKAQGLAAENVEAVQQYYTAALSTQKDKDKFLAAVEDWTDPSNVNLSKLNKAEIVDHALAHHDLELDPNEMTKEELVNAVEEARATQ